MRGIVHSIGFSQFAISYSAADRHAGTSKYHFKQMLRLAMQGFTSFSVKPLHLATWLGFIASTLAGVYAIYALFIYFYSNELISGWASVLISILFMGGAQLIILGIFGDYLGRLFIQSKMRPNYIVNKTSFNRKLR